MNDMAKDYAEDLRDFAAIAEREGYGMVALAPATLRDLAAELDRLCAKIQRLENECYKKCGVCEFDYGRAAPPLARSGESG